MTRLAPLLLLALFAAAPAHGLAAGAAKTRAQAEKLLGDLSLIDSAAEAATNPGESRRLASRARDVYERAAKLPASDLRTDLATAARLYLRAFTEPAAQVEQRAASPRPCEQERPGAYRRLCDAAFASRGPSNFPAPSARSRGASLLLAKARLHSEWARAAAADGAARASAAAAAFDEMRAERLLDAVVARQALTALAPLEAATRAHESLADFEESRRVGHCPPAEFARRLAAAAPFVRQALAWLPEGELKAEIDGAWQAFADGLWWWQRAERPPVVRASAAGFAERDFAAAARLPAAQLGYNAVANLRHARRHTRRAAELLGVRLAAAGVVAVE